MPPDALAGLDPEQRLVAEALAGPVVVHAGAGTGKTRAITHRIAHAIQTGRHQAGTALAVTFTNRAAGEMRLRLAQLGVPSVAVRTFHAAALSQLRYFWPSAIGGPFPELVASKAGLLGTACRELGIPASGTVLRDLAAEVEWAGSTMVAPGDYVVAAEAVGRTAIGSGAEVIDLPGVARVITAYQDVKSRAHAIDFEDVLLSMVALLGDRPDIADEVRRHYRWFTVDEYQDITPAQEALLAGWLGDRDDVCVVGDVSQTIYSFAGADLRAMSSVLRRWPDATVITLDRCYRCTPEIVAVANSVIRARARPQPDPDNPPVLLRAQRESGATPDLVTCADDADEASTIAGRITDLIAEGRSPRDIAVLMRTNAASQPLEAALAQARVPYVMRGAERFFDRPEVREALVRLRGHLTATAVGPGPDLLAAGLVEEVEAVLAGMGWQREGPASGGATRERWESLAAVVGLAAELEAEGRSDLAGLVAEFERRSQLSHAPTADGVTLATLHAAKGLEWPVVFLIGCSEGNLPIVYADTPARVDEERRLFYVGLTRARDRLVVSWAMSRGGSGRSREPSRFLSEMRDRAAVVGTAPPSGMLRQGRSNATRERRRRPPATCRVCGAGLVTAPERTLGRCGRCPGRTDEVLAERLRRWRSATAEERGVPAFVVFTDLTLDALAERRPRDDAELLDIPGIGPAKAELYGKTLLEMVHSGGRGLDVPGPQDP